jgi:hypothetical protein
MSPCSDAFPNSHCMEFCPTFRRWSQPWVPILIALAMIYSAQASEYEVDGTVNQSLGENSASASFTVYVKDCSWLISTTETNENGHVTQREIGSTNVGEMYEYILPTPVGPQRKVIPTLSTILPNSIPVGPLDDAVAGHLWLMFASQCYWTNLKTNRLTPIYDWEASIAHPGKRSPDVRAEWDLLGGPGSLPKEVRYFPVEGLPHVVYRATGSNLVNGILIPTGFYLEQHSIRPFNGIDLTEKWVDVVVTAVRPVCSRASLIPSPGGKTLVIDRRVDGGAPTNRPPAYPNPVRGEWATVEQAKTLVNARRAAASMYSPPIGQPLKTYHRRPVTIVLLCAAMLGPVIIYFASKRSGRAGDN